MTAERRSEDFRQVGARIEEILTSLGQSADPACVGQAEEAVRLLVELYGGGLERIVGVLEDTPAGRELLTELTGDDLVASLLIVHGLHPVPVEDRITEALDTVRPYLGSHAGGVEVLGIDEAGVLQLRLQGSCDGCPSSAETVRLAIEKAVLKAAPEVVAVEAEGMVVKDTQKLLQIQPYRQAEPAEETDHEEDVWQRLDDPPPLQPGEVVVVDLAGAHVLLVRTVSDRYAYRDRCPACDSALAEAAIEDGVLTCPQCQGSYDLARAGRPLPPTVGAHLQPLPLLSDGAGVRIAVPASVGTPA